MVTVDYAANPGPPRCEKALQSTFAELAGALAGKAGIEDVLVKLTSASLALIPNADCAKISVIDDGDLHSIAATSQLTDSLDGAQRTAKHGPCFEAINGRRTVRCDDLRSDTRWPQFARHATHFGVHSILCSPIDIPGDPPATLTLFGYHAKSFGVESETVAAMLANYASIALLTKNQERHFEAALATRDVIGQAKGMIMERFGVDASRAFAMLTAISQETNTPVRDLAVRYVESARQ